MINMNDCKICGNLMIIYRFKEEEKWIQRWMQQVSYCLLS